MKEFIVIGLAFIGLVTLGIDYFLLEKLVSGDLADARKELWIKAGMIYLILLVPPFIMTDPQRRENVELAAKAGGLAVLDVTKYLAIGILLYMGWHLASNVFHAI